jgi:hypothetical protein
MIYITVSLILGLGLALYISRQKQEPAIIGCNVTAATVERELQQTRWEVKVCEIAVERLCTYTGLEKCKEILSRPVED